MLQFRKAGYNKKEIKYLKKALTSALIYTMRDCKGECLTCEKMRVCRDLNSIQLYLTDLISR